ncbi:hypothetical protein CXB51_017867 [Gossypium anomalum]|uniref:CLAVATA3/ESR (CLE)-related protein 25 n=1 Tax=Gossypium anomalum TaxID=47600 RepID=A0A8J5YHT1_9ROSI|nr:hypothetical protein CXB51_017867 [Gossypium anomalum]
MASNSLFKTFKHNRKIMGKSGRALRCFFAVAVLVGVVWLLFVSIVANRATVTTKSTTVSSTRDLKHWEFVVDDFHFNYVSRRRVPNGPDPIHNRRVSKSRQPPGRA